MATVEKFNEDVYLISWKTKNTKFVGSTEMTVNIPEISQSCRFTYRMHPVPPRINNSILEMEIEPFPLVPQNENCKMLQPVSVLAIKNGVKVSMQLKNSKWTATFSGICACGQPMCGSSLNVVFQIWIDFKLTSMKTETKHVMSHLLNLWETKTLADVTFKFKEKEVEAHTIIIASGSPVLAAMFQNSFKEKQERVVVIDSNTAVFEKMLRFFYTGDADLNTADVTDLLILANMYGVDPLKEKCALFMAENLTVENVIRYLVVSHLHLSPCLYESALEFISENSEAIVTKEDWIDLMKSYHELSVAAVQKMVLKKKKTESRKDNVNVDEEFSEEENHEEESAEEMY